MRRGPIQRGSTRGVRRLWPLIRICAVLALAAAAATADEPLVEQGCVSCHRIEAPDPSGRTLEALAARKGPDLYYAGSKLRTEWLREWLRAPARIRPAGLAPYRHAETVDGQDQLQSEELEAHPRVRRKHLDSVVDALAELDWGQALLPEELPAAPRVPRTLAEMNFVKFKGCASCHRTAPDFGGVSGPELYTAWERLRPEFLFSYIADPQAWDPVAPMPGYALPDGEVAKLVDYLRLINEERKDD